MILIERLTPKKRLLGFNTEGELVARECTKCSEYKPITEYSRHAGTNLGWDTKCIICTPKADNEKRKQRKAENLEVHVMKAKAYRDANKSKINASAIEYRKKKPEVVNRNNKIWKSKNKHRCIEYARIRQFRKKKGINQLSETQKKEVLEVYKECRRLNDNSNDGTIYCVDHIIPLTHLDICGLHAPQNLTILTKLENNRKYNKFDGTIENESWRKRHEY